MSDDQDTPRQHNARKADARRLQACYPGLRYTDAYAASTPKARTWRKFEESGGYPSVASCARYVAEAAALLAAASQDCGEPADRDRLAEGSYFANWLATRLFELAAFVEMVRVCSPLIPDDGFESSPLPGLPGPLRTHTGLHDVIAMLTVASSCASIAEGTPGAPAEVQAAAQHVHALQAWISPASAGGDPR